MSEEREAVPIRKPDAVPLPAVEHRDARLDSSDGEDEAEDQRRADEIDEAVERVTSRMGGFYGSVSGTYDEHAGTREETDATGAAPEERRSQFARAAEEAASSASDDYLAQVAAAAARYQAGSAAEPSASEEEREKEAKASVSAVPAAVRSRSGRPVMCIMLGMAGSGKTTLLQVRWRELSIEFVWNSLVVWQGEMPRTAMMLCGTRAAAEHACAIVRAGNICHEPGPCGESFAVWSQH